MGSSLCMEHFAGFQTTSSLSAFQTLFSWLLKALLHDVFTGRLAACLRLLEFQPSKPCMWSPMLSHQEQNMTQEPEGSQDVMLRVSCFSCRLRTLTHYMKFYLFSLGFSFSSNRIIKICLLYKNCGGNAVQVQYDYTAANCEMM